MKKYMKMIRKGDIIIVMLLMISSFLPLGIFSYKQAHADDTHLQAIVQVDGETLKTFNLEDDGKTESFLYHDDHGHENLIVRTGTSIEIQEASCRDQVCVQMNSIRNAGDTILCLPHRVLVEVVSDGPVDNQTDGVDIIS
ncbi:NusG domain II-containing protein [Jeotgalibaca sp. MA1X17-3]|uniref:NusG domain II-containing protein n=1 Tax=Jeotgalibaca sp. MA1X17-3 TaxID=2908211 RepID=UPI001F34831B|nr:NusG domain II-containing protein [Jeotgalibaca sp. MA1X17-3]UJF15756.1 NusG domain II-containing protein [Jeotgalibaca sp. MA1X17-3]